ncbi:alpha-ketoglutarate-dependent 2,4-dichlorophenoxyacetate dioxygenase [Phellopilus nigrolimitatus]|nr:alpha-ketoglutarate-dependent 2,4-dichlorophenoxyacetate dioxygenase [Phellopilus nigrolimitatus]
MTMTQTETRNDCRQADLAVPRTAHAREPIKVGSLTCKPLHPSIGAEIEGVDFRKPVSDFKGPSRTSTSHNIAFSRQLGKLENAYQFNGHKVEKPEIYKAGNIDENGNIIPKTSSKYSLLLAHVVPKEGGNTGYADERHAFRDLSEETEANLWHSRKLAAPEQYNMLSEQEVKEKRFAYHKLVQIAPDGGEVGVKSDKDSSFVFPDRKIKTLYMASHASEIVVHHFSQNGASPEILISQDVRDVCRKTVYDDGPKSYGVPGAASSA